MLKNRLSLIVQREYLEIVAKKSFILVTLLSPLALILLASLPVLLSSFNDNSDCETVAVVDYSNKYGKCIKDNGEYRFQFITTPNDSLRSYYSGRKDELYAIVVIPSDVINSHKVSVFSENTPSITFLSYLENTLDEALSKSKMQSYNMPDLQKIIDDCDVSVDISSVKWSEDGEESSSSALVASVIGVMLSFLTYMFVLMYGSMIMSSVIEEKSNRIVEVIVSSCKPIELLMGKIIGIGLVGITQIAIWTVLLSTFSAVFGIAYASEINAASTIGISDMNTAGINESIVDMIRTISGINFVQIITYFVLYFIGGYLLYASLFAAFGSAVDQASDANQLMMPLMTIVIIALYVGIACMENPNGQLAFWCSMIPFTSPIVMMIRIPYDIPFWQVALSLFILFSFVAVVVYMSAKIYRTGILLYGKKHTFKDLYRWLINK